MAGFSFPFVAFDGSTDWVHDLERPLPRVPTSTDLLVDIEWGRAAGSLPEPVDVWLCESEIARHYVPEVGESGQLSIQRIRFTARPTDDALMLNLRCGDPATRIAIGLIVVFPTT